LIIDYLISNNKFVVTQKGVVDKNRFYLSRDKLSGFDGDKVWFTVTKEVANIYKHD
jgi:hypothetical protein